MRIYYQGQLDFFCAVYATINALGILGPIPLVSARNAFADILDGIAGHKELWEATTRNDSDFYWLVKYALAWFTTSKGFPKYSVSQPFVQRDASFSSEEALNLTTAVPYKQRSAVRAHPNTIWHTLENWLPRQRPPGSGAEDGNAQKRAVILRFHRYMRPDTSPFVMHWSAADTLTDDELLLRDASCEQSALHSLARKEVVFQPDDIHGGALLHIEPESLFLIERTPS